MTTTLNPTAPEAAVQAKSDGAITLKDQWKLALAMASDPELSRGDVAVGMHIIDRYFKSKGNSRASNDLLADKAHINRRNTVHCLKRLRAAGYVEVLSKGRRGRATEYVPAFGLGCAPGKIRNPNGNYDVANDTENYDVAHDTLKYGVAHDTLMAHEKDVAHDTLNDEYDVAHDTLNGEYGVAHDIPTYLPSRPTRPGVQVSRTSDEEGARGAASPPPLCASSGAGADTPRDPVGFDELWNAWPNRTQRPKAKDAYRKLAPDEALHQELVATAKAWAEHYQENGVERRWIPFLHTWIAGERWLEDVPAVYEDPKAAAIANRQANGPSKGRQAKASAAPEGEYEVRIVTSEMRMEGTDKEYLCLEAQIIEGPNQGKIISDTAKLGKGYSSEDIFMAQQALSGWIHGLGLKHVKDSSEMLGIEATALWEKTENGMELTLAKPRAVNVARENSIASEQYFEEVMQLIRSDDLIDAAKVFDRVKEKFDTHQRYELNCAHQAAARRRAGLL